MGMIILIALSSIGREVTQGWDIALSVHLQLSCQRTQSRFCVFTVIQDPTRNFFTKAEEEMRQDLCWADPLE